MKPACSQRAWFIRSGFYEGQIHFEGEEGYTSVNADRANGDFLVPNLLCGEPGSSWSGGPSPGSILSVKRGGRNSVASFEAVKNRLNTPADFDAEISEQRGEIEIFRHIGVEAGPASFIFDSQRSTAMVEPPPPFTGTASFQRQARGQSEWTGNFEVDFPGRAGVPLTGPAFSAMLIAGGRTLR